MVYYVYLEMSARNPLGPSVPSGFEPDVTVIVPTYNEVEVIERRLNNIEAQGYRGDRLEVLVVDSASVDGTVERVFHWSSNHDTRVQVVREDQRRGKAHALNTALKYVEGEIVVLADADSLWAENALDHAVQYFSHKSVGAVTAIKEPLLEDGSLSDAAYRSFNNRVRLAESKIHSTPICHGELLAFKKDVLIGVGGFSLDVGGDDSHAGTLVALEGYRSIAVSDAIAQEPIPDSRGEYFSWRVRRAKHLIQHFSKCLKRISKSPKGFKLVLSTESFLHLVNPWILLSAFTALAASFVVDGLTALNLILSTAPLPFLLSNKTRKIALTWISSQVILIYSAVTGIRSKELVWKKIGAHRRSNAVH
jgi:biofilm PGA synthesis N-glycosyltransferase PgaC